MLVRPAATTQDINLQGSVVTVSGPLTIIQQPMTAASDGGGNHGTLIVADSSGNQLQVTVETYQGVGMTRTRLVGLTQIGSATGILYWNFGIWSLHARMDRTMPSPSGADAGTTDASTGLDATTTDATDEATADDATGG